MARASECGPALASLLVVFLAGGAVGSQTYSFWKVVEALNHTTGLNASIEDPSLRCMTGNRTQYNLAAETATYLAHYKALNGSKEKYVTYDYTRAYPDVPNKATLVVGKDYSHPVTITVGYTDYLTCFVTTLPFDNISQCILLVQIEFVDQVPLVCSEAFTDICGPGFPLYNKDLCGF